MSAQQTQDALYIFRNDGGFNAFFYADIDRIEYSKIDTLGVEQSDYVVQEVYALDSCFRIPVSAIDSVAFVTPETKYKADVVLYDENIANYIVASDSINWFRLATNTPTSLIPKKGDKLVIESESTFLPNGMAGLVERVEESATGYTVNMGEVEIQDIYERLLVKAGAGAMNNATSRTRGLLDPIDTSIEPEPIHWGKFKGSFTAQGSKDFISSWFPSAESTVDAVGSISYDDDLYTTLRIFLYADKWGVKYDYHQRDDIKNSHVVSIGGAVTSRFEIPFGGAKLPIKLGDRSLVLFNATWGVFIEGSLAVNINFSDNLNVSAFNEYGYTQNVGDGWEESIGVITNDVRRTIVKNRDTNFKSISGKGSLGSGLYGKIEAKLKFNKIKFQLGIGINIGVRVELQPTVDIDALVASTRFKTPIFYRMANFDGAVTATGFANIGGSLKAGKYSFVFQPELPNSREFGIVPNITDINWIPDKKTPWRGKLESNIKRDVLIPMSVGFAVYDEEKEKLVEDYWTSWNYWRESTIQKYNNVFDHFNPGKKYWAYAQTTLFGIPVLTTSETDFSLGDPYIKPEKNKFDFDEAYNSADIEVITNIANVEFKESDSWISKPTWLPQTPSLLFDCDPLPDNVNIRKGKITAVGRDWDGNIIKEDSISITQRRGILKITPANLEFDKKGGTQKVTIETTYDNVEVVKGSEYTYPLPFEMSLNASKTELTVTVPENTTGDSRRAAIIVSATTQEGKKISEAIYLYQSAEDESPYYIKFKDSNLELGQDENTYELTSECNFFWYKVYFRDTYDVIDGDKHKWFSFKNGPYSTEGDKCFDKWYLTVEKNDWGVDRNGKIELLICDKDSTMTATTTIYFTQKAGDDEAVVFPTKFDEATLHFSGTFIRTRHYVWPVFDEDVTETKEEVDGFTINIKNLNVSHGTNTLFLSGEYSEKVDSRENYIEYVSDYSEKFSVSIKNITGLKDNSGVNWKGNYFEGSYIDHVSASINGSTEYKKYESVYGNSSERVDFSSSAIVEASSLTEDPWGRWKWSWRASDISQTHINFSKKTISRDNHYDVLNIDDYYDYSPVPGAKYAIEFSAIGYLPDNASSRTRGAHDKQTSTASETITRMIE